MNRSYARTTYTRYRARAQHATCDWWGADGLGSRCMQRDGLVALVLTLSVVLYVGRHTRRQHHLITATLVTPFALHALGLADPFGLAAH